MSGGPSSIRGTPVSLRGRLTAAFATVTILPILVAAVLLSVILPAAARDRGWSDLYMARDTVAARLAAVCPATPVPTPATRHACDTRLASLPQLRTLVAGTRVGVTVVIGGQVAGSSLAAGTAARLASVTVGTRRELGGQLAVALAGPAGATVIVSRAPPGVLLPIIAVLLGVLAALALAGILGFLLTRRATRPLAELADAASRVAAGDLSVHSEIHGGDEVGRLAESFNGMTAELRSYVGALESSRDELRRNLSRLGDTLSNTHDLGRILEVILDTATSSVRAQAGALLLTNAQRTYLYLTAETGLEGRLRGHADPSGPIRVRVGPGVCGRVALTGESLRATVGYAPGMVHLAEDEPTAHSVICVPLRSAGLVTGVLSLYDPVDAEAFDDKDLDIIRTFAGQAAGAIDNVLLHQEAQRLSVTDGLTGLWNYRYLTTALSREVERATRFDRPLALIILDLDRFKDVNDVYGHQRGDAVLLELAGRVTKLVREVDTVARYGGEELVLVLPETDLAGAEQLAERIWYAVRSHGFGGRTDLSVAVTTSLGISVFPEHGTTAADLLKAADEALYVAKRSGRDCWRVARSRAPAHS
jgi:diguanylate cyclase (GGDEF)-like protein